MLTLIRCPFHPRVTAVARKRPRSFDQKCRWQVTPKHAYTLDPSKSELADYATVQEECENPSGNELTRNTSGNTRSQSSQLAEPLWTDPGLKSGFSLRELISMGLHRNHVLAIASTGEIGRGLGKNAGEWTGRVEISKGEIPSNKRSMYGYILTYSRL